MIDQYAHWAMVLVGVAGFSFAYVQLRQGLHERWSWLLLAMAIAGLALFLFGVDMALDRVELSIMEGKQ